MSRHIDQKVIGFLDERLNNNGLANHALAANLPRVLLVEAAKVCVGIREKTGHNDGPMVEALQRCIGGAGREPWCMSFVQSMIAYVEFKFSQMSKDLLHSPIAPTEHCMTCWRETPVTQRVEKTPLPGAIIIWRHGKSDSGHTGIVLGCGDKKMQAVEGNTEGGTDPNGEVIREGGGVYFTERSRFGTGSMGVVGFLKPF